MTKKDIQAIAKKHKAELAVGTRKGGIYELTESNVQGFCSELIVLGASLHSSRDKNTGIYNVLVTSN